MSANDAMACLVKGIQCMDAGDQEAVLAQFEAAIKR